MALKVWTLVPPLTAAGDYAAGLLLQGRNSRAQGVARVAKMTTASMEMIINLPAVTFRSCR